MKNTKKYLSISAALAIALFASIEVSAQQSRQGRGDGDGLSVAERKEILENTKQQRIVQLINEDIPSLQRGAELTKTKLAELERECKNLKSYVDLNIKINFNNLMKEITKLQKDITASKKTAKKQ